MHAGGDYNEQGLTHPAGLVLEVASLIVDAVVVLALPQKLHFPQDVLPFLHKQTAVSHHLPPSLASGPTSVACFPVKFIFFIATTSLVLLWRACQGGRNGDQ